jgi:1,4-dihydroxy-6-naphthoate synthase
MKIKTGFSPCPNDTFIFHALLHGLVETEGLEFEPYMADVEELNTKAFNKNIEVTKLSYFAFAHVLKDYALLNSGSALGSNCGPLLINKTGKLSNPEKINIAIPGKFTTANFLLSLYLPEVKNKTAMLFSKIEEAVINGDVDAGLIIHENRFTFEQKGLKKIVDLGEWWEEKFKLPIPLGGIAVNRKLDTIVQQKIERVMQRSVAYAMENPEASKDYVKKYSKEMENEVINKHINLYVNNYTLNLGEKGRDSVKFLINKAMELNIIPHNNFDPFVENTVSFQN